MTEVLTRAGFDTATINGNAGGVWVGEEWYELCERRGVVFRAFPEPEASA